MTVSHDQQRWQATIESSIDAKLKVARPTPVSARYFLIGSRVSYALVKFENNVYSYFDQDSGEWVAHPAVAWDGTADVVEVSPMLAHHLMGPVLVAGDG